jgi:hypothetical protein
VSSNFVDALGMVRRIIVSYSGKCEDCDFMAVIPRASRIHCMAQKHRIREVRGYILEPTKDG